MQQMVRTILDLYSKRYIQKKLVQHARENSKAFPQLACYTFDYIAININIYGRYELKSNDKGKGACKILFRSPSLKFLNTIFLTN
jgi:hypothetical protein